jgi:hypothetical protein
VFTFRCPGCGKQHTAEGPFEEPYTANCLRCGEAIRVTRAIIHVAGAKAAAPLEEAITTSPDAPGDDAITAQRPDGDPGDEEGAGAAGALDDEDQDEDEDDLPLAEMDPNQPGAGRRGGSATRSRSAKKRRARAREQEPDAEQDAADSTDDGPVAEADDGTAAEDNADRRKRLLLVGGIVAVVLALGAGGGYFLFAGRGGGDAKKSQDKKPVAKAPATKREAPPATQKSSEKAPEPPPKPKEPDVYVSAPRLSAELAADAAAANAKYKDKLLQVSGVFEKAENTPGAPPPGRVRAVFGCDGSPVTCELPTGPPDTVALWRRIQPGQQFTVWGTYGGDGSLRGCELKPPTATADAKYKGKVIEVSGSVQGVSLPDGLHPFPSVRLERDTDSLADLECVFRAANEEEVKKLQAAAFVTVRGTCAGRLSQPGSHLIRMDNCELVYTTAPAPPAVRVGILALLREYEEDLRAFFLPAPGEETRVAEALSLPQLNKDVAADAQAADKKYRNKVVTVSGKLLSRANDGTLVLISGNTDEPLKVSCRFTAQVFAELKDRKDYAIRGRWTGVEKAQGAQRAQTVRLESCESADPSAVRDPRRITPDYLPHRDGRELTYDVADYPIPGKKDGPVERLVMFQRADGVTETVITHAGNLVGKSLFDPGDPGAWVLAKKTAKDQRVAGPEYRQRIQAAFVEVGTVVTMRDKRRDVLAWEPVLKLGARVDDTWKWRNDGLTHEYAVEQFDNEGGRPRVIIRETLSSPLDPNNVYERCHVYVRDVGEVERRDWRKLNSKERVLVSEKRLVPEDTPGKTSLKPDPGKPK